MTRENDLPLVSIIMNCYNGERFLREALDSVLSQTYKNWELIFFDNCSVDASKEILCEYSDDRIKYFKSKEKTNLSTARILAMDIAQGEFIAFLDVDDYWYPGKLEAQIPLFKDASVSLVCGNFNILFENKILNRTKIFRKHIQTGEIHSALLRDYSIGLLSLVVRKNFVEKYGGFDSDYHIIGDFDLCMRYAMYGKVEAVQEPIATLRLHSNNESLLNKSSHLEELYKWSKYKLPLLNSIQKQDKDAFFDSIRYREAMNLVAQRNFKLSFYKLKEIKNNKRKCNIVISSFFKIITFSPKV
jgi:glycosyltransferase involved in cell wall biosynthesis